MIKKSPGRNPRAKGVKVKHVLQMCVLIAVCFWLIYQVKHSHDKKKELDETDAKVSVKAENDDAVLKLGRKDISRVGDIRKGEQRVEEEEDENTAEDDNKQDEEAIKHEEEDQEERQKPDQEEPEEVSKQDEEEREEEEEKHGDKDQEEEEEKHGEKEQEEEESRNEDVEDESRGGGDDEIDQNEQDKDAGEVDHGDLLDEEKEREEQHDENENEENEGREENENASNDENHEAREENYKADDASSAVSHDSNEKLSTENSNENSTINVSKPEKEAKKTEETDGEENHSLLKSEKKHIEDFSSLNNTSAEEKDPGNSSLPNAIKVTDSNDLPSNNLTEVSTGSTNKLVQVNTTGAGVTTGSVQNVAATTLVSAESQNTTKSGVTTGSVQNVAATTLVSAKSQNTTGASGTIGEQSDQQHNKLEQVSSTTTTNSNQSAANDIVSTETQHVDLAARDSMNSSSNAEATKLEGTVKSSAKAVGENSSESLATKERNDAIQSDNKSKGNHESGGAIQSISLTSTNGTIAESLPDPIDSSDSTLHQD